MTHTTTTTITVSYRHKARGTERARYALDELFPEAIAAFFHDADIDASIDVATETEPD